MDTQPTLSETVTCPACGAPARGRFCSECASPLDHSPGAATLLREDAREVVGIDSKVLRTLRDLLLRPARVVRSYVEGRREYFPPLRLFFWLGGTYMLLLSLTQPLPFDPADMASHGVRPEDVAAVEARIEARGLSPDLIRERFEARMNTATPLVVALSVIPLAALLRLLHRRRSFQQHVLFMLGMSNAVWIATLLVIPVALLSATGHMVVGFLVSMVYLGIAYLGVNREPSRAATWAKLAVFAVADVVVTMLLGVLLMAGVLLSILYL